MKFIAEIDVMPLKALLDPQGKAVGSRIHSMGIKCIDNIRIGKHISLELESPSKKEAEAELKKACDSLLHNPIMESYQFTLEEIK